MLYKSLFSFAKKNNTVSSDLSGEPLGSVKILNVVVISQSDYDVSVPVPTTLYIINDQ